MLPAGTAASTEDDAAAVEAWAASGALALTGRGDGPALGPPAPMVVRLAGVGQLLSERSAFLGRRVAPDVLALLGERAAVAGLTRGGTTSCGGATRLLPAGGGAWVAVALARPDDVELLPAWLGSAPIEGEGDPWPDVAAAVGAARGADLDALVARAHLLGLPVAVLPDDVPASPVATAPLAPLPLRATAVAGPAAPPVRRLHGTLVVDLTSLWAGPLCTSLLTDAGARVVRVEATRRPDGARRGPAPFFDLMNAGKESVALDLAAPDGRRRLARLLRGADVVVEASRPRALEQVGVRALDLLGGGGPRVWVSITGHGRDGPGRHRVAFGDDAAVAGGLVARDAGHGDVPCFCADAVADPVTGVVAAAATLDALAVGGRWLLDVGMAGVAAHLAGPTLPVPPGTTPSPPRARPPRGRAAPLGAHTAAVVREVR